MSDIKNHPTQQASLDPSTNPDGRMQELVLDHIGPFPSVRGLKYVLTIRDHYTGFLVCCPVPSVDAADTIRAFSANYLAVFGVPVSIQTDRGAAFTSQLFREYTAALGIKLKHSCSYHPASQG